MKTPNREAGRFIDRTGRQDLRGTVRETDLRLAAKVSLAAVGTKCLSDCRRAGA